MVSLRLCTGGISSSTDAKRTAGDAVDFLLVSTLEVTATWLDSVGMGQIRPMYGI